MFPPYPQHKFLKFIKTQIPPPRHGIIADAPCGSGYITYMIAKNFNGQVIGADISTESIAAASDSYKRRNLSYLAEDIHSFLDNSRELDAYLLINSIFLLPQPKEILAKVHSRLANGGRFFVVIPNTKSRNFISFQRMEPGLNSLVLDKRQAMSYFEEAGFKVEKVSGLAYTRQYGNRLFPYTGKLRGLYTYACDRVNRWAGRAPSYWGFILTKK